VKPHVIEKTTGDIVIRWGPIEGTAQELVLDDLTPEAKLLFTGGYGSGKTTTQLAKTFQLSAINGDIPGIMLVPDYGHFEDTILEKIKSVDPATGRRWFVEDSQFNYRITRHGSHILEWEGGGDWHIMSAVRPNSIKGPERAWMTADEPGIATWDAWRNAVNRVRHQLAVLRQVCAFGTSEGLNWLAQLFTEAHEASYYRVYKMRTADNRELLKYQPDYMKQVLEHATEQEAKSYLDGEMVNLTGATAYSTFDRATHWRTDVPIDPHLPLRISFDFNVDPMACVIGQIVKGTRGPELNVIDAVIRGSSWTPEVCQILVERYGRDKSRAQFGAMGARGWPGGCIVYGDATGGSRSTTSLKSNYQLIEEILGSEFPGFKIHPSAASRINPAVPERLNAMKAIFRNALGHVRCYVRKTDPASLSTTYQLVRSLEMTQIAPGTMHIQKPAGETHSHASDALGYLVCAEFPVVKPSIISGASFGNQDVA
jgi:hypothetical protein